MQFSVNGEHRAIIFSVAPSSNSASVAPLTDVPLSDEKEPDVPSVPAYVVGGKRTPREWLTKYFLEGQKLAADEVNESSNDPGMDERFLVKYRKYIALAIPFFIGHFLWWSTAISQNFFALYPTHWQMPLTMILGATVAGMTSEGGGAVAFPVMTFVLHLNPETARDFSLMIQTTGMSMALFVILFMRIQIEWRAIVFGTVGAVPGALVGFHYRAVKKMMFVSIWSSFAVALWMLNRERKRTTFPVIPKFNWWKASVLVLTGMIGGIFTSFAGSGVDICIFSTITLLFSVTEKTATPTTIVIMALNSQFCIYWRTMVMGGVDQLAWDYLKVTIPVAITFAPLGSFLGSHFHRQTLACFVYVLESVAFIGFLFTRPHWILVLSGFGIIATSFVFFSLLSKCGKKIAKS